MTTKIGKQSKKIAKTIARMKRLPVSVFCEGCGKEVVCDPERVIYCKGYTCGKLECLNRNQYQLPRTPYSRYELILNAAGNLHGYNVKSKSQAFDSSGPRSRVELPAETDRYGLKKEHRRLLSQMYGGLKLRNTRNVGWGIEATKIRDNLGIELIEAKMIKTFNGELYFLTELGMQLGERAFFARARDPREWLAKKHIPEFNKRLADAVTRLRDRGVELTNIVVVEAAQNVLRAMRIDGLHHRDIDVDTRPPLEMLNQFRRGDRLRKNVGRARHYK